MATPIGYTLGALLCGTLPDLTSSVIRSIITSDTSTLNNVKFLSDITLSSSNFTGSIYNTQFVRDTGSTFASSSGVYLSASSTTFDNITSAYYSGNLFYIYNYIDTGDPTTSNMISYDSSTSSIQGPTDYKINNDKILFFTDTADNTKYTYRYFNELLMKGLTGNLNNNTIGIALLSNSYTLDINHTSYSDISAYIIAEGTAPVYVTNGTTSASLKTLSAFTPLLAYTTGQGDSLVFYISAAEPPSNRRLMCALSGTQIRYNTIQDDLVYFRAYQSTIMHIS